MAPLTIPVDQFDPNNLPPNFYGLYAKRRFIASNNRASIIQKAYNAGDEWSLWEWRDGAWHLAGHRRPLVDGACCGNCGRRLVRITNQRFGHPHSKLEGEWGFKRTYGKIDTPMRYMRFCTYCNLDNQ